MFIRLSIRGAFCLAAALGCALIVPARVAAQSKRGTEVLESKIRALVNASGAETVAVAFRSHIAARQPAKLLVNDGRQLFQGAAVSFTPGAEQRVDVIHRRLTGLRRLIHPVTIES